MEIFDQFLALVNRNLVADVNRLNSELRLEGESMLVDNVLPHTFVGNLDKMEENDCILVIGINPFLWDDPRFEKANVKLPFRCLGNYRASGNPVDLLDWFRFQNRYFLSDEMNETHFKKIANLIGPRYFPNTYGGNNWKQTLFQHIVEVDIVPYYSTKARINDRKLADLYRNDPALIANLNLIKSIIKKIQPKWIQVNGKAGWSTVSQELLEDGGIIIDDAQDKGSEIMVGHAKLAMSSVPVLMHKFIGGIGGANSHVQRNQVMDSWDRWLEGEAL